MKHFAANLRPGIPAQTLGVVLARGRGWMRILAEETGDTLVEFAVAMTLLLTLIFAILDFSRAIYFDHYVRYSADEAARYAMVRGSTWNGKACASTASESCTATSANVKAFVTSITPIGSLPSLSVLTTWTGQTPAGVACNNANGNNSPGCVVQVQVAYNFSFVLPFMPNNSLALTSTSAVAVAQ
jgi:Flp pilus assembly protein TadG